MGLDMEAMRKIAEMVPTPAVAEVQKIYSQNFFPEMKVNWRAYPNNIGHTIFPGCYRCHDGKHKSAEGKVITHDCKACHTIISQGNGEKLKMTVITAGMRKLAHVVYGVLSSDTKYDETKM